jgi:Flp pilus assembly protein TadB
VVNDRLRIGDAEREAAAQELGEHFALGRITAEEHAERLEQIMTARTEGDLAPAFRDLPRPRAAQQQPPRPAPPSPVARRDRGWDIPRVPFLFKLLLAVVAIWWGLHHFLFLLVAAIVYVVFVRRFIHRRRRPWSGRSGSWGNSRCQTGWH